MKMKKKLVRNSNIKRYIYFTIIIISGISTSCSNSSRTEKTVTTSDSKSDSVIVITGKWEQVKKREVVNKDTLPQENSYIFINSDMSITKVENDLIVYTFMLSKGNNNRTFPFNEGANNVHVKNDSILSIKYDQDEKEEVFRKTHTLIEYLRSKHVN